MPAKKRQTKPKSKTKKPAVSEPAPREVAGSVTEAPAPEPELLHEAYLREQRARTAARSWMWVGVVSMSVIIVILWGWSLKLRMTFFSWNSTSENSFIERTKQNWNDAFAAVDSNPQKDAAAIKEKIKNAVNVIVASSIVTSSVSTTTTSTAIQTTVSTTISSTTP